MSEDPKLLRVPHHLNSVADVLATAARMDLPNVVVLSMLENGNVVFLTPDGQTIADLNWLLDRMKAILLYPDGSNRVGT